MVEFALPKNSKPIEGKEWPKPEGANENQRKDQSLERADHIETAPHR